MAGKGKEEGKRKQKAKKDPDAPKRPRSGYIFFSNEVREEVRTKFNLTSVGDVAKKIGGMWGELTAAKKAKYEQMQAEDKVRYEKEMAAYNKKGGARSRSASPKKSGAASRSASPAKPTRGKKPKKSAA